jgi:hypothetical protein
MIDEISETDASYAVVHVHSPLFIVMFLALNDAMHETGIAKE